MSGLNDHMANVGVPPNPVSDRKADGNGIVSRTEVADLSQSRQF
ncbi:hypothetical protein EV130_105178 [Rhizobium azibense]|nr:hypothetical protein EV130_105178 [Rhizobium azibense]TCU40191.1 hypothetical protein EV129_102330 [Rhizobium azibense]